MATNRMSRRTAVPLLLSVVFLGLALVVPPVAGRSAVQSDTGGAPVLVGVVWHEPTGPFWQGIELAAAHINEEGGLLGRPLHVVARTDRASLELGMRIAEEFAATRDLVAVVGHYNSFIAVPAADIYERAGIVFITPHATSPQLTQPGYRYVFRTVSSDAKNSEFLAAYLLSRGYRRVAIYYAPDPYGRGLANGLEDAVRRGGGDVVDRISYFGDEVMLTRLVQTWQALGVDALVVADVLPRGGEFIERVRRAGYTGPIVAGDGLHDPRLLQHDLQAVEGLIVLSHFHARSPRAETREFIAAYRHRFGEVPGAYAALAYDALRIFGEAVRRAGSFEAEAVSRTLREASPWNGVTGTFGFDERGDPIGKEPVLSRVERGRFVYVDESDGDLVEKEPR